MTLSTHLSNHLSKRFLLYLALFISALSSQRLFAQSGQHEVRITVKEFDCATSEVIMQVWVRASSANTAFFMGDANYRFEYDPRQIRKPQIVSQDNFSNAVPSRDLNYGSQNLNGSTEGASKAILSLNTFYTGSAEGAKRVSTDWTPVSCLKFMVMDTTQCFNIAWHDDKTFPITGMNEVLINASPTFDYSLNVVASSGVYMNLNACYEEGCKNRAPFVDVTPITVDEDKSISTCFKINDPNAKDTHTITVCQSPKNGILNTSINPATHEICMTFMPDANFYGKDSICLNVCDNGRPQACTTIHIPIVVNNTPDTPSVSVPVITVAADSPLNACMPINDPDGQDTYKVTLCGVKKGTAEVRVVNGQLCLKYISPANFMGKDTVCVIVCDGSDFCHQVNIPISVTPCSDNTAPIVYCPKPIEVSITGTVISDESHFITSGKIADNCKGVVLDFIAPDASDDCTLARVVQVSGGASGSVFALGDNTVVYRAADLSGKTSDCEIKIKVTPIKLLNIPAILEYCRNEQILLKAEPYPKVFYKWTGPNVEVNSSVLGFPLLSTEQQGIYTISATFENGCAFRDSVQVSMKNAPRLENDFYIINKDEELRDTVTLNDTISTFGNSIIRLQTGANVGTLNFKGDGSFSYRPPQGFTGSADFVYEVCYDNCPNSCQKAVAIIKVADKNRKSDRVVNVITPNDDETNDALEIEGLDPDSPNNKSEIIIFSQWGEQVYKASPYRNNWKGTYKSLSLPEGTYYYVFKKDPDSTPVKGFVTIIK